MKISFKYTMYNYRIQAFYFTPSISAVKYNFNPRLKWVLNISFLVFTMQILTYKRP